MIRTQISLTEDEYNLAKKEASRQGISLAKLFRLSLRTILPLDGKEQKPWMRYCGSVETGDKESSQKIDDLIYGQKD